jgi:hypothetical protein
LIDLLGIILIIFVTLLYIAGVGYGGIGITAYIADRLIPEKFEIPFVIIGICLTISVIFGPLVFISRFCN